MEIKPGKPPKTQNIDFLGPAKCLLGPLAAKPPSKSMKIQTNQCKSILAIPSLINKNSNRAREIFIRSLSRQASKSMKQYKSMKIKLCKPPRPQNIVFPKYSSCALTSNPQSR